MATTKKSLQMNSEPNGGLDGGVESALCPIELQAEYQRRQRSARPLPASIAKAYEVLIARQAPNQER